MSHTNRGPDVRYEISVLDGRFGLFAVRIFDLEQQQDLVTWQGAVARHLLVSGALPIGGASRFGASKSMVWHIVLAAAAFSANEELETPPPLAERIGHLGIELTGSEARLARLLFEYPGQHLSRDDVICLCSLRYPGTGHCVPALLDRLVDAGVIQKIEIDRKNVFFDLDTRPHVHVFNRSTLQLFDAPTQGVIQTG